MPGRKHPGPSIKLPRVYEALRRQGKSKQAAAAISNSMAHKTPTRSAGKKRTTRRRNRKRK